MKSCDPCDVRGTWVCAGHVIFEMACGFELTEAVPGKEEVRAVKDNEVKDILSAIFHKNEEGSFTSSIEEVRVQFPFAIT